MAAVGRLVSIAIVGLPQPHGVWLACLGSELVVPVIMLWGCFGSRRSVALVERRMHDVSWWLFIVASIVLIVTPGQDMILVMSRSIAQGSAAGVATAAGVSVGLVGHTLLATLGLGAILRTSEWLFVLLKLVGAAYLVYLGVQLLRTRSHAARERVPAHRAR